MKILQLPIRASIVLGILCGLSFFPLNSALDTVVPWSSAICLTLWLFVAINALFLSRWSKKKFLSMAFPILVLFFTVFLVKSIAAFFLLVLVFMSWIRSGICFPKAGGIKLAVEMLLCGVGGVLTAGFTPGSAFYWVLGVWMLFLVQALYFAIFDTTAIVPDSECEPESKYKIDPFTRASQSAEDILNIGFF